KLMVVVVDGRSSQSQGLTIPQLSSLMEALGCTSALNYDGGGSSTAWVKNEGIVNFPSDNGKFDHEGERGVATVFTVKSYHFFLNTQQSLSISILGDCTLYTTFHSPQ